MLGKICSKMVWGNLFFKWVGIFWKMVWVIYSYGKEFLVSYPCMMGKIISIIVLWKRVDQELCHSVRVANFSSFLKQLMPLYLIS